MTEHDEVTDVAVVEAAAFDIAHTNPRAAFERAQEIVQIMAERCRGPQYIANIQGKQFPRVEWWVTVGNSLNLFPRETGINKFEFPNGGYGYEATVEVWNTTTDRMVTRASAICTTDEKAWGNRDEYAVRSMATTRATGKAYRIGLSSLAVMAGLEPTPADEIPPQGFDNGNSGHGICPDHGVAYFKRGKMKSPAHPIDGGGWCNKRDSEPGDADDDPAEAPRKPTQRKAPDWASDEYREAIEALNSRFGPGQDTADQRATFVAKVLGRKVHTSNDLAAVMPKEWTLVKEAAESGALADAEELDRQAEAHLGEQDSYDGPELPWGDDPPEQAQREAH